MRSQNQRQALRERSHTEPAKKSGARKTDDFLPYERVTLAFVLLLCGFYVLYFDEAGLSGLSSAKRTAFYLLGCGYPAMLALLTGFSLCTGAMHWCALWERLRQSSAAMLLMLAYLLFTLISALVSPYGSAVWLGNSRFEGVVTIALYVADFYLVALFARPGRLPLYVLGASMLLLCTVSILQIHGGNPLGLYRGEQSFAALNGSHVGTIGNVGFVGGLFCLAIPLFLCALLRLKEPWRFALLLPLLACVYVLLRIWVLAAFVGLGGGLALALPFVLRLEKRGLVLWFSALGALGLAALAVLWGWDAGSGFLHELHELLHGRSSPTFGTGRFFIWQQLFPRISQRLWFGYGPDTMGLVGLTPFSRYDAELGRTVYASIDAAHNEYLNVLFHQGVFALAAYLGALGCSLRRFVKHARSSPAAAMLGTAVLCYMIQALFGISQLIVAPLFWLCLGLLEADGRR